MNESELDAIPLFAGIVGDCRRMLTQNLVRRWYRPGEIIVAAGGYSYEWFVIETGTATARADGRALATIPQLASAIRRTAAERWARTGDDGLG